jgi:hypothetical protein
MKRLLLIGFAVCAFAVVPTLSASAMPRATPDTLVAGTDSAVILVKGGHGHGRAPRSTLVLDAGLHGSLRHKFNSSGALTTSRSHCFR